MFSKEQQEQFMRIAHEEAEKEMAHYNQQVRAIYEAAQHKKTQIAINPRDIV